MKFRKGDLVTGTRDGRYTVTDHRSICKVIEVRGKMMEVAVVSGKTVKHRKNIGVWFTVEQKYFKLHNSHLTKISENYEI